jgi:hypothetical protein
MNAVYQSLLIQFFIRYRLQGKGSLILQILFDRMENYLCFNPAYDFAQPINHLIILSFAIPVMPAASTCLQALPPPQ